MAFVIKAEVRDPQAKSFTLTAAVGSRRAQALQGLDDGRPETKLNFKFYRQATNKIAGISAGVAAFLEKFF